LSLAHVILYKEYGKSAALRATLSNCGKLHV